jgi:DNA-binding MarR family transcriptional regulator
VSDVDPVDRMMADWKRQLPEVAVPELELVKRVARLAARIEEATHAAIADKGITYAEYEVLTTLRSSGSTCGSKDLSLRSSLTTGGTSNVVNRLAAAGLVERVADPDDARRSVVKLTPRGVKLVDELTRRTTVMHQELFGHVGAERLSALIEELRYAARAEAR